MKYVLFPALALLAACSATTGNGYDVNSLQDAAAAIQQPEPSLPFGFVSLLEQQPDGKWVVRDDAAPSRE